MLEELNLRAREIPEGKVAPLVATLFALADELDIEADELGGYSIANNHLRIHWLMNRLVSDRFAEDQREAIYGTAMKRAALHWACDFARRCRQYFEPREDGRDLGTPIVSQATAEEFREIATKKLREAAASGELIRNRALSALLFEWGRLSAEGNPEVRHWTDKQLSDDRFIVAMSKGMTSVGWTHSLGYAGMGDRVAHRTLTVHRDIYREIIDVDALDARVAEMLVRSGLSNDDRLILKTFQTAPRGIRDVMDK